jgi:hypothetical protein
MTVACQLNNDNDVFEKLREEIENLIELTLTILGQSFNVGL